MSPYRYLSLLLLPVMVWAGYLAGGYWNFTTPAVCFFILPIIEGLFRRQLQWHEKRSTQSHKNILYRIVPLLFTLLIIVTVAGTTVIAGTNNLTVHEWIGLMISVGILNGAIGFTLAHEFIHRFTPMEKGAGYLLLGSSHYLHYSIEHVYGHHVYACTAIDPHTARKGESFYRFLPRAIVGTWMNAWHIEKRRLQKIGCSSFSLHNRMIQFLVIQFFIYGIIGLLCGKDALLFFIAQGVVAVIMLHQVNYLQHYGLLRKESNTGKLEKMAVHHSWNTANPGSKFSLFQLENHADHHIHPARPYEKLVVHNDAPALPGTYATMMLISLMPPLWFRIIHHRMSAHS